MPSTIVNHEALPGLLGTETVHPDPAIAALRDQWWDLSGKEVYIREKIRESQERLLRVLGGKETIEMTILVMTGNAIAPQDTPEDEVEDTPANGS
jgi:hypothetical protein